MVTSQEFVRRYGPFPSTPAEARGQEFVRRFGTPGSPPTGRFKGGGSSGGGGSVKTITAPAPAPTPIIEAPITQPKSFAEENRRAVLVKQLQFARKAKAKTITTGQGLLDKKKIKAKVLSTGSPIVTEEEFRSGKTLSKEQFIRERERQVGVKGLIKEGDIPGAVRESSRVVGTGIFKQIDIGRAKLFGGETISPRLQRTGGTIIGETGLFIGASPVFKTTAQVQKEISSIGDVKFLGKAQQVKDGKVETVVRFQSESGGVSEKGIARAVTVGKVKGDVTLSQTVGVGRTFSRGVKFPSGKLVSKPGEKFAGAEIGFTRQAGKGFVQVGIGKTARGSLTMKNLVPFKSVSAGVKGKTLTFFRGVTVSTKGRSVSTGLIKSVQPRTSSSIFEITSRGQGVIKKVSQVSPSLKLASETSLQNIVRSSVTKPITKVGLKPFVSVSTPTTTVQLPKETSIGQVGVGRTTTIRKQNLVFKPKTLTTQVPVSRQGHFKIQRQRNVQKDVSKSKQIIKTAQIPLAKSSQVSKLGLGQAQALKLRQRAPQKQIQKSFFVPIVPRPRTTPKTPKILPFFLPKGKSTTRQPKQFNVFLRRRGKFKLVGQTQTQARAFEIGRGKAAGTLGATFKVEGGGVQQPIKIPGFKTKKSKKGTLFIELPKFRLSKKTETKEIQLAKRSKPRKKKKGGRK